MEDRLEYYLSNNISNLSAFEAEIRCHGTLVLMIECYGVNKSRLTFSPITFLVPEKYRSWRGNKCCQLFVSNIGFVFLVLMQSKGQFPSALKNFCKEIRVLSSLLYNPSGDQALNSVKKWCSDEALPL